MLLIVADDYGYGAGYDLGVLEAAQAGAIDAVGVMVSRAGIEPGPLLETGISIGLHLELEPGRGRRAGAEERDRARTAIEAQIDRFGELFGRLPDHLDGHRHCHARAGLGVVVSDAATRIGARVRSVDARHRRLLRCRGVSTPDALVGRYDPAGPAVPPELADPGSLPALTEWMVHPGYPDRLANSSYDEARAEDLAVLLGFRLPEPLRRPEG